MLLWEASVVLVLIVVAAVLAAAEVAFHEASPDKLQQRTQYGDRAASRALRLLQDRVRVLTALRVAHGVCTIGIVAWVSTRAVTALASRLDGAPVDWIVQYRVPLAWVIALVVLTVLVVVLCHLVPRKLASSHPEDIARGVSRFVQWLTAGISPIAGAFDSLSGAIARLLGSAGQAQPAQGLEEIERAIHSGTAGGVIALSEQRLAIESLRFGDRMVREIMQPRGEIDALDAATPADEIPGAVSMAGYTRVPVYEGTLDQIIGYVHIKDIMHHVFLDVPIDLKRAVHPILQVPETLSVDRLLLQFQQQQSQMAVVLDEFGGTEGLVTMEDVLETLVGDIRDEHDKKKEEDEAMIVRRDASSWLVHGAARIDELLDALSLDDSVLPQPRPFSTSAGLILNKLRRIPKVGEHLLWQGLRLEVIDMDGPKIDRLLVTRSDSSSTSA
mgnify:CR=1 FL=1